MLIYTLPCTLLNIGELVIEFEPGEDIESVLGGRVGFAVELCLAGLILLKHC